MSTQSSNPDADLIQGLGGPTKVAELLGYDKAAGGVQRVQNWLKRGIPPAVKVQHPSLFLNRQAEPAPAGVTSEPAAAGRG